MPQSWNSWGQWGWNQDKEQQGNHHSSGQWWKCPCKECTTKAGTPTWNASSRRTCHCCGEPRESKAIDEEARRAKIKEDIAKRKAKEGGAGKDANNAASNSAAPRRKRKSKKARSADKNKENEEQPSAVPSVDTNMEDEEEEESEAVTLPPVMAEEEKAKARRRGLMGLPPPSLAPSGADALKLYPQASLALTAKPEDLAAKALAGQASEALATLQKQVANLHSLAGMAQRTCGADSAHYKGIAKELEVQDTALRKMVQSTPAICSTATAERLGAVRRDVVGAHTARAERAKTGREKAIARFQTDQGDIDRAVEVLLARKAEHAVAFLDSQASFAAFDQAKSLEEAAVLALVDAKIQRATPVGGTPAPAAGLAPAALVPAVAPAAPISPASHEDYTDLELNANVQLWSVPVLTQDVLDENPEAKAQIDKAWAFFANSPAGAVLPPMTYRQLGFQHMDTVSLVIGAPAMSAFYGGRTVFSKGYVPWQAVELIRYSLTQSNQCLARDAASKTEALERLQMAREAAKEHGFQRPPY